MQALASPPTLTLPQTKDRVEKIPVASTPVNDEELLSDAFSRSHVSTLSALDDMTPHARDIVLNRRNKQYK